MALSPDGLTRTTTREIRSIAGQLLAKSVETEQKFGWGWGLTAIQQGDQPAETRTYTSSGQLQSVIESNGHWRRYAYDTRGRLASVVTQLNSNPFSTADSANRVEQFDYAIGDFDGDSSDLKDQITDRQVRISGVLVERDFSVWYRPIEESNNTPATPGGPTTMRHRGMNWHLTVRCASPASYGLTSGDLPLIAKRLLINSAGVRHAWLAGLDDATLNEHDVSDAQAFRGRSRGTHRSDGTSSRSDPDADLSVEQLWRYEGRLSRSGDSFNEPSDGRRTYSLRRMDIGQVYESTTSEYEGFGSPSNIGTVVGKMTVTAFDPRGRASVIDRGLTGSPRIETRSFNDCCGSETSVDEYGITSRTFVDEYKRPYIRETQVGPDQWVGTRSVLDELGRTVAVYQRSLNGTTLTERLQGMTEYDLLGRVKKTTDASGAQTSYIYDTVLISGQMLDRTTEVLPAPALGLDPTELVTLRYQDGAAHSTSGSATRPTRETRGVDSATGMRWTQVARGAAGTEWVRSYVDALGRNVLTTYAPNESAVETTAYTQQGSVVVSTDADGIRSISVQGVGVSESTAKLGLALIGRWQVQALDVNKNGIIDLAGPDLVQITRSRMVNEVPPGKTLTVYLNETVNEILIESTAPAGYAVLQTSRTLNALDGRETWTGSFGEWTHSSTAVFPVEGRVRTTTTTMSSGAMSVSDTVYGRQGLSVRFDAPNAQNPSGVFAGATIPQYDLWGRVEKSYFLRTANAVLTGPDVDVTEFGYNSMDRVITRTDPAPAANAPRLVTTTVYDTHGRVTSTTQGGSNTTTRTYWPTGEIKTVRGFGVNPVDYTYDDQGRLSTLTTYKDAANAATAAVTQWEYDPARGWLTGKRYHGQTQPSLQYTYTPGGRLLTRTNGRGIVTTYNYRLGAGEPGNGGLLAVIDYADGTPDVQYTYDRRGRMINVLDAAGYRTIAYTNDGQPTAEDIAWNNNSANLLEGLGTNSSYGQTAGLSNYRQRTQMELKNNNFVFHRMKYEYNADRRLSRVRRVLGWSQSDYFDVLYGYDTLTGQVNQTTYRRRTSPDDNSTGNELITGTRAFDRLGRLTNQTWMRQLAPVNELAIENLQYDVLGRRTARTIPTVHTQWNYQYDQINQLTSASAEFLNANPPQEVPGAQFGYDYDQIGNRNHITTPDEFSYTTNALNQYTSRAVPDTVQVAGNAKLSPIVQVWSPGGTPGVATDAWRYMSADGFFHQQVKFTNTNVARREYVSIQEIPGSYSEFQIFIPKSPETMTYDADGNLLSDSMWDYTWDAENRLTAMQLKSAANLPIMQIVFAYDHMGRRIRKMLQTTLQAAQYYDNGATQLAWSTSYDHRYLYQGPAEWLLGATMVVNEYSNLYDQQLFAWGVDLSGSEQGAGGIGGLVMFQDTDGGGPMMPLYDTSGNVTHLFDRDGLEQAEYQYGPFGEVRGQSRSAAAKNPFRFSTKFTDNETGLVYYGYRYYSASIGRWISRDPIEEGDGPNVMAFVKNAPTQHFDGLGLSVVTVGAKSYIARLRKDDPNQRPFNPTNPFAWWWLATGTDMMFNENPLTDDRGTSDFRLFSRATFDIECKCDSVQLVLNQTQLIRDGGTEPPRLPILDAVTEWGDPSWPWSRVLTWNRVNYVRSEPRALWISNDGPSWVSFRWRMYGRPNEAANWGLQLMGGSRTSVWIWHEVSGTIWCDNGVPKVDADVIGSRFPSHRLWVDGAMKKTVYQRAFSDLWYGTEGDKYIVR